MIVKQSFFKRTKILSRPDGLSCIVGTARDGLWSVADQPTLNKNRAFVIEERLGGPTVDALNLVEQLPARGSAGIFRS